MIMIACNPIYSSERGGKMAILRHPGGKQSKFKVSLDNLERPCFKVKRENKTQNVDQWQNCCTGCVKSLA